MTDDRLAIDKNQLDSEFIGLPQLMQIVCDEAAEAITERDIAEETLAMIDAQLYKEISGQGKYTVDMLKSLVTVHTDHKEAFINYQKCKLAANKAIALEKAVKTKERSLEQLSELFRAAYWVKDSSSSPRVSEAEYNSNRAKLASGRTKVKV